MIFHVIREARSMQMNVKLSTSLRVRARPDTPRVVVRRHPRGYGRAVVHLPAARARRLLSPKVALIQIKFRSLSGYNFILSCRWETPNSRWGDTGSDCAVGRRHPGNCEFWFCLRLGRCPIVGAAASLCTGSSQMMGRAFSSAFLPLASSQRPWSLRALPEAVPGHGLRQWPTLPSTGGGNGAALRCR
jgi:hypothetical protein